MNTTSEKLFQHALAHLRTTPPDYFQALPLLQQAAASGHPEAQFQLAGCYFYGNGIAADIPEALKLLEKAANQGHLFARYNLLQWQENQGINTADLLDSYEQLAESGLLAAQLHLLEYYQIQHHTDQVFKWASRTAEQGHPYGQYSLAQYYQHAATPDPAEAHQYYRQAAEQNFPPAHWQLGNQYRYGQSVHTDWQAAAYHFRQAAEAELISAQTALGEILLQGGHGLAADPATALAWLKKAAEHGDTHADAILAEQYLTGRHSERNPALARSHAENAAQHKHPLALRLLGDIYRYGLGVTADTVLADQYYDQAAQQGDLIARQKQLAAEALKANNTYEQTKQQVLQHQHIEQIYQKAFSCHYGLSTPPDYAQAHRLYLEAAKQGHNKAQTNLGMMYYNGQGVDTDMTQAAYWFEQAARQNDTMAQYNLACLYYHGAGVSPDTGTACIWLQKAIDNGHPQPEALLKLLQKWQQSIISK
ncbi:tetratricopeptide repeat protein [Neisseria sp. S1]|uniref:tetratricopeptide repeat protein n=1 Tax=Neisseria sp. S1 TaxID=3318354 RepID=UPI003A8C59E4